MLWGRGYWEPEGNRTPEEALAKGDFKFTLEGKRLHGNFVHVRMAKTVETLLPKLQEVETSKSPFKGNGAPRIGRLGVGLDEVLTARQREIDFAFGAGRLNCFAFQRKLSAHE